MTIFNIFHHVNKYLHENNIVLDTKNIYFLTIYYYYISRGEKYEI